MKAFGALTVFAIGLVWDLPNAFSCMPGSKHCPIPPPQPPICAGLNCPWPKPTPNWASRQNNNIIKPRFTKAGGCQGPSPKPDKDSNSPYKQPGETDKEYKERMDRLYQNVGHDPSEKPEVKPATEIKAKHRYNRHRKLPYSYGKLPGRYYVRYKNTYLRRHQESAKSGYRYHRAAKQTSGGHVIKTPPNMYVSRQRQMARSYRKKISRGSNTGYRGSYRSSSSTTYNPRPVTTSTRPPSRSSSSTSSSSSYRYRSSPSVRSHHHSGGFRGVRRGGKHR